MTPAGRRTALDLYAGAGGASLGLSRAGWDTIHVEADPDACATLSALWGLAVTPTLDTDLFALTPGTLPTHWWASPPCQPFSRGRRRAAREPDPRDRWPVLLELVLWHRPSHLIVENVPGMVQNPEARAYTQRLVDAMGELFPQVAVVSLNAWNFGVPQERGRLFFVCGPHVTGRPAAGVRQGDSMADALGLKGLPQPLFPAIRPLTRPAPTVTATEYAGSTLRDSQRGKKRHQAHSRASCVLHAWTGRTRLTLAECAILQGLPDDYPFRGTVEAKYRQVGNAVPPPMAEAIVRSAWG